MEYQVLREKSKKKRGRVGRSEHQRLKPTSSQIVVLSIGALPVNGLWKIWVSGYLNPCSLSYAQCDSQYFLKAYPSALRLRQQRVEGEFIALA
jgi:hypothetical protein